MIQKQLVGKCGGLFNINKLESENQIIFMKNKSQKKPLFLAVYKLISKVLLIKTHL
jgi:hypothetical protein